MRFFVLYPIQVKRSLCQNIASILTSYIWRKISLRIGVNESRVTNTTITAQIAGFIEFQLDGGSWLTYQDAREPSNESVPMVLFNHKLHSLITEVGS